MTTARLIVRPLQTQPRLSLVSKHFDISSACFDEQVIVLKTFPAKA